jgi:hypothetical protein
MVSQSLQGGVAVQGALDRSLQLTGRAVDRLVQGRCLVSDGGGLAPLESGLHNAAYTVLASLVAVHVAEMDFHPRDPIAESVQGALHHAFNMGGELLASF